MPYTINKTNGTQILTIQDGTLNTTAIDLTIIGKNYSGYGEAFNENFVKVLENFANSIPPKKPLQGQLWFDTARKKLRVYEPSSSSTLNSSTTPWKPFASLDVGTNFPSGYNQGELFYHTEDKALYAYTGQGSGKSAWTRIGPIVTRGADSGAIASAIKDTTNIDQTVVKMVVNGVDSSIFASSEFTVSSAETDIRIKYPTIKEGINLPGTDVNGVSVTSAANKTGAMLWGTAGSALGLVRSSNNEYVSADQFLKRTEIESLDSQILTSSDEGVLIGNQRVLKLHITSPSIGNVSVVNGFTLKVNTLRGTSSTFNVASFTTTGTNDNPKLLPSSENIDTYLGFTGTREQFAFGYINTLTSIRLISSTASITTADIGTINATTNRSGTTLGNAAAFNSLSVTTVASTTTNATTLNATTVNGTTVNATTVNGTTGNFSGNVTDNNNRVLTSFKIIAGTGIGVANGNVTGPSADITIANSGILSLAGTANQVNVSAGQYPVLSLPQNIHTAASPTFEGMTLKSLTAGANPSMIYGYWELGSGARFQATYADLAERYEADGYYAPGTVLIIGGEKEVTTTTRHGNTARAGIVSTKPAYTLNAKAGDDKTHPYIALAGRVPCNVVGPVRKGEMLVTSTKPGFAERAHANDHPNAVLARALEDFEGLEGVIEVMVV